VPTAADNVIFDSATVYTVTLTGALTCLSFTVSAGTVTFTSTGTLAVSGSFLIIPGTVWSATGLITFNSTTTGNTITTNSVSMAAGVAFDGVGGAWTFGSAFTSSNATPFNLLNGDVATGNFNLTFSGATNGLLSNAGAGTRSLTLGSSTVTASGNAPVNFSSTLTLNAGTSSIVITAVNPVFTGGAKTFYSVSSTYTGGTTATRTFNDSNTFTNLTVLAPAASRMNTINLTADQTVTGTLTLGPAATPTSRISLRSSVFGTPRTLTVAAVATLSDVDFRDITIAGASAPWSGTRLGNAGGNTNVTFAAGTTKYWSSALSGNWSATAWALTSGGVAAAANFPLAQDTAVIDNLGLVAGNTITLETAWLAGTIDASGRTLAATFSFTGNVAVGGDFRLSTAFTLTGTTAIITMAGRATQTLVSAGRTLTNPWVFRAAGGTVVFSDSITSSSTVTLAQGTMRFLAGSTNTATTFSIAGGAATPVYLTSSTPGTQFTLSRTTGTVSAVNTTISDSNATGGATWQGLSANNAIDAGNNTGWVFDIPFGSIVFQQPVRLRSFTERGRD
jgi:hypothetical protein